MATALLAGCKTETGAEVSPIQADAVARKQCESSGGRYGPGGLVGNACFQATPDAGKACSGQGDCSGLCLAETQTCSVETPLFGCHSVMAEAGKAAAVLCID